MYKILTGITENYYGVVAVEYKTTSNFNDVLVAKGMKKLPLLKRIFNTLQSDRISSNYPAIATVAKLF